MAAFFMFILELLLLIILVYLTHEAGHALAIALTGAGRLKGVVFNLTGVGLRWEQSDFTAWKLLIVALAGPAANILAGLMAILAGLPVVFTVCQFVFGLVNLVFAWVPAADGAIVLHYFKTSEK